MSDAEYLANYNPNDYPRPAVTVDIVVFTIFDGELNVLLIERKVPPFTGRLALPGGFVRIGDGVTDQGEDLDAAAQRELSEETGLATGSAYLEQLYTFGDAYRDPRMRVITVAYYALVGPDLITTIRAGSDAADARWLPVSKLAELALAFDHQHIVDCALERIRGKLDYSDIAFALVRDQFTISELRAVHEIIESQKLDPGNFRRRINRLLETGWIREASGKRPTSKRPAQLYCYVRKPRRRL